MNWFNLAFIGWLILIVALAIAAHLLGAPKTWIAVGSLALVGLAMIVSVKHSKPNV